MSQPITITATVAAWLPTYHKPHELLEAVKAGNSVRVASLLPHDEQVRMAVQGLQRQLDEDRAKWLQRQQQILEQIQNLQAITYEAETVDA